MSKTCAQCAASFDSPSPTARFCSARCRKAAFRARQEVPAASLDRPATVGTTVEAVRAELEAAGRVDSYLGRAALALALRVDTSTAVMGFGALVKELRATMDAATGGFTIAGDPVDELRARRDRILRAGGA